MSTTPERAAQDAAGLLVRRLAGRGLTLATAESLTGGGLGAWITGVPGSSAVFRGGVIGYASDVKVSLLGVPESVVAGDGVVSEACAEAMAQGVRRLLGSDLAVSTTGVAGPESQEGKPVGLVFVGLADAAGTVVRRLDLSGDREEIRRATVVAAAEWAVRRWG